MQIKCVEDRGRGERREGRQLNKATLIAFCNIKIVGFKLCRATAKTNNNNSRSNDNHNTYTPSWLPDEISFHYFNERLGQAYEAEEATTKCLMQMNLISREGKRESKSCGRVLCRGQGGSARRALQLTEINLIEMQRHLKFDVVELEGSIYMLHTHIYTSASKWFVP